MVNALSGPGGNGDGDHRTQLGWGGGDRRRFGAFVCDNLGEARRLAGMRVRWSETSSFVAIAISGTVAGLALWAVLIAGASVLLTI